MIILRVLFLPVTLAILGSAAVSVPLPMFVEVPAPLISLPEVVAIEAGTNDVNGDYLLTAVNVQRATPFLLGRAMLDSRADLLPVAGLVPSGLDDAEYFMRQRELFRLSAEVAAALGLQAAGYPADPLSLEGDGALVDQVVSGTPAAGTLRAGDVIVAVNGDRISTGDELRRAIRAGGGEALSFEVQRDGDSHLVDLAPAPDPADGRLIIGIVPSTFQPRISLPVPVQVDAGRIGGPSAGLMIALTVYDEATADVDLAAGRNIAGTGALEANGRVQPIGGIRQKVLAAAAAGIDVFLVPVSQLDVARAALRAASPMRLEGVATLDDAIGVLRRPTTF